MKNRSLIFRYILLFITVVFSTAVILNTLKNEKIQSQLRDYNVNVNKSYLNAYEQTKKIADLIFFDNFLYDKNILGFYENYQKNKSSSQEKLYAYIKNKYYHYKSFGVKEINFYLPNNELFLAMKNKNTSGHISSLENVKYVNRTFEDISGIELGSSFASLKFTRAVFNDNLEHIGSVELEFSLDYISTIIQKNLNFDILFVYNKSLFEKSLEKQKENIFDSFILNNDFLIEDNKYNSSKFNRNLFEEIKDEHKDTILNSMSMAKKFSLSFSYLDNSYPALFIPLFSSVSKKNNAYIIAFISEKETSISMIMEQYKQLFYLLTIFYIFLFLALYFTNKYKNTQKNTNKKYEDLVNAIDKYVVMVETNKKGIIVNVTEAFCDICGYTKKELISKNVNIIRHPDVSKRFFEHLWRDLRKNKKWEGEIKNLDKYGNSYWVKATIFAKYDTLGEIIGFTSIRVNVTDAKQLKKINHLLKEDLSNKLNEIKMKDKNLMDNTKVALMGKILDSLSHQWKNPMSNISIELANLSARVEKNDINLKELKQIHNKIEVQLKNLSLTLNEFKSSFTQDQRHDKYNAYSAVKESINLVRDEAKLHNITISLNSKKELYCYGVYNELKHIIINLLKNSIEQISSNSIKNGLIDLSIIEDGENILIKCSDNARGNSKQIIDIVFNDNYDENLNKDIGINLYITKLLIEKSGAKIWFENNDYDTTFYIKLVSEDRRANTRK